MAWNADRLVCCFKASNIGSIFSTVVPPLASRILLAELTSHVLIVELYRHSTNSSSTWKSDSNICVEELAVDRIQFCKSRCYLWKYFSGSKKQLFTFSGRWRWGIATAKSMKKYFSITYRWSESFADFVDEKEFHSFSSSKSNPKFI